MTDLIEGEIVESAELVAYQAPLPITFVDDPEAFLEGAARQAKVLKSFLDKTQSVIKIGATEHVRVGGWQFLAQQAGLSVGTSAEPFEMGDETGWKGHAIVYRGGIQMGEADALCLRSEANWKSRDTYALCSMAQTRAVSKAIKGVLGFVVVMAGYSDTPAEEMPRPQRQSKDKAAAMRTRIKELAVEADTARGDTKTAGEIEATVKTNWDTTLAKLGEAELGILGTDLKQWLQDGCKGEFKVLPF